MKKICYLTLFLVLVFCCLTSCAYIEKYIDLDWINHSYLTEETLETNGEEGEKIEETAKDQTDFEINTEQKETVVTTPETEPIFETETVFETEKEDVLLPLPNDPTEFYFSSGAGAWGTELTLYADGAFKGGFHDSNMGEIGEDYPNGTVYVCSFSGKFEIIEKINDYSYKMTLSDIKIDRPSGEEWIEDGIKYISSGPYGIENGKNFILFLPDTPIENLSEEFLYWWPHRFSQNDDPKTTLSDYGIMNVETKNGFFSTH